MPIYEYYCNQCQQDVEVLVRGKRIPKCPKCGGRVRHKRLSVPAPPVAKKSRTPCGSPCGSDLGKLPCGSGHCPWSRD